MRILFFGHDLSYAQFFATIERALREHDPSVECRHFYSRPSAWVLSRFVLSLRAQTTAGMRLAGRWPARRSSSALLDFRFYAEEERPHRLECLHDAYLEWFCRRIGQGTFDLAVLPGEFRLIEQSMLRALSTQPKPPRLLYFEAGPPGYVYFDAEGVNANASFARTGKSNLKCTLHAAKAISTLRGPRLPKTLRAGLLALDVTWLVMCKVSRGLLDLREYWVALSNRLKRYRRTDEAPLEQSLSPGLHSVVFVGQVRDDINHTHFGLSETELLECLRRLLLSDPQLALLWRDHPLERSDQVLASLRQEFPGRVARPRSVPLAKLFAQVEGVVTVNSNAGLEALAAGMPVRLLGRAYYGQLRGACLDDATFLEMRLETRRRGPSVEVGRDAARFLEDCFLPIDYRAGDFRNADLAAILIHKACTERV